MGKDNDSGIPFPENMEDIEVMPDKLITEEDSKELFKWMMGMTSEPPEAVQKIAANMATKINIAMGYVIAMNLKRIDHLSKFMKETEDYLFDASHMIANEEDKDKMLEYYESAGKQMKSALEWTRKYVYQNKKELKEAGKRVDKLKSLLMSLPHDKLDVLIQVMEKGNIDKLNSVINQSEGKFDPDVPDDDVEDEG